MPWKTFKTGEEFCVFKLDGNGERTGKTLGCHPTNDKAKAQVKALYADEEKGEAKEVDLVQVARSAIELARAWCNAGPDGLEVLNKKNTNRLLNSLERDLKEAKANANTREIPLMDAMTVDVDGQRITLDELLAVYRKAETKKATGESMEGLRELLEQALSLLAESEGGVGQAQESNLCESASGVAIALTESEGNGAAPLKMSIAVIEPGFGNEKNNHYYGREMLERDSPVFKGIKMYTTDHRPDEKSVRTEVSQVLECPTGFTDTGAPIALVGVFDEHFAQSIRNRDALGTLSDLHCSILATGDVRKGEIDGKEANVVEAITSAQSVDWVTQAGAGGHALNLAESDGGDKMKIEQEVAEETTVEVEETEEVALAEQQEEAKQEPQPLPKEEIAALLSESNLPKASQERLAGVEYEDEDALKAAMEAEVAYVKRLTGSGKPTGLGASTASKKERMSEADAQKRFGEIEKEHGLIVQEEA